MERDDLPREDEDWVFVPRGEESWGVRFLTGPFPETVVEFGTVSFDGFKDQLSYNFEIIETPDILATTDNQELIDYTSLVLESIILFGMDDGTVEVRERDIASES